jgi:hypothetical protein
MQPGPWLRAGSNFPWRQGDLAVGILFGLDPEARIAVEAGKRWSARRPRADADAVGRPATRPGQRAAAAGAGHAHARGRHGTYVSLSPSHVRLNTLCYLVLHTATAQRTLPA